MPAVQTTLAIDAPPDAVWRTLTEPGALAAATDGGLRLEGPILQGARHRVVLRLFGPPLLVGVTLDTVRPSAELAWSGGVPGLLQVRHGFTLAALPGGGTRLTHHESFDGPLGARVFQVAVRPLARRYDHLNRRIAAAAVRLASAG